MFIADIRFDIENIVGNSDLLAEENFDSRTDAIDYLEFHVLDRIDGMLQTGEELTDIIHLKQYAEEVKYRLEAANTALFDCLRKEIRAGKNIGPGFGGVINNYVQHCTRSECDNPGYDNLDVLINGLLPVPPIMDIKEQEPEMVYYQKTPARIIFQLVAQADIKPEDVFYDLGSGLGHTVILVHLLSGIRTIGIEIEPAYCNYAKTCVEDLQLLHVAFANTDARAADYSVGTIFFMYTPFEGHILNAVLEKLWLESQNRSITIFTYGPCTLYMSQLPWLRCISWENKGIYKLAQFKS